MSTFMHEDTILSNVSFFLDSKLTTQVEIVCLLFVKLTPNHKRNTLIIPLLLNLQSFQAHGDAFVQFLTIFISSKHIIHL